jgi:hypothetical protein
MAGRGAQTFNKRQKEQLRKEKQQEKIIKRQQKKTAGPQPEVYEPEPYDDSLDVKITFPDDPPARA